MKNGCPAAFVSIADWGTGGPWPECDNWQTSAIAAVADLEADVILYANYHVGYRYAATDPAAFDETWSVGVREALAALTASSRVVYFGQFPVLQNAPDTRLAANLRVIARCSTPTGDAVSPAARAFDTGIAAEAGAIYFDPSTLLCDEQCALVDHNRIMYRDGVHLTGSYSALLAPAIGEVIRAVLPAQPIEAE